MPYYESVLIARQDLSATQVEALADGFAKTIEEQGGRVAKRELWGLRTLAFRIRKHRKGHYVLFNIDGPAAAVHELERQVRISEDVLRCLTVRVEALEEGPSAMMQSRSHRGDERGRREDRPRHGDRPPSRFRDDEPRAPRAAAETGEAEAPKQQEGS
ncbi:MAG: 30S ribosomal protein S6 [Rhodospirillales bacterium]